MYHLRVRHVFGHVSHEVLHPRGHRRTILPFTVKVKKLIPDKRQLFMSRDRVLCQLISGQYSHLNNCLRFKRPVLVGIFLVFRVSTCALASRRRRISSIFSCFFTSFLIWSFPSFCLAACSTKLGNLEALAFRPLRLVATLSSGLKSGSLDGQSSSGGDMFFLSLLYFHYLLGY